MHMELRLLNSLVFLTFEYMFYLVKEEQIVSLVFA